jgi:hypothetical protein
MKLSIAVVVLIASIACSCQGQQQEVSRPAAESGVYAALPASDRESLRAAVDELVALQKAGDWARIYDLQYDHQNLSKKDFVRQKHGSKLLRFVPEDASSVVPEKTWLITGCGAFQSRPTVDGTGLFSSIYAHKVGNAWRLSPVAIIIVKDYRSGVRPCTFK